MYPLLQTALLQRFETLNPISQQMNFFRKRVLFHVRGYSQTYLYGYGIPLPKRFHRIDSPFKHNFEDGVLVFIERPNPLKLEVLISCLFAHFNEEQRDFLGLQSDVLVSPKKIVEFENFLRKWDIEPSSDARSTLKPNAFAVGPYWHWYNDQVTVGKRTKDFIGWYLYNDDGLVASRC